jgi:purine-nucleoside phosphorylase
MLRTIAGTASYIRSKTPFVPKYGIILGTGLGGLVKEIEINTVLDYQDIPNFPVSTVESHSGRLIFGTLGGKPVVAMQGRFHYYEGYTTQQVTFPVRVMQALGVEAMFVSNASGGLNPDFEIGDLMIINDHINLLPNPLVGKNYEELGPRFPDMSQPYDANLIQKARAIASQNGIKVQNGVYLALSGPSLETPAEYRFLRIIGADAVGMSTVPEVIVARHQNIPVFAISIVTDLGVPGRIRKVALEEIVAVAEKAEPQMTLLLKELITSL